jgi:O-antigen/teichoic acid export membrane protein
LANIKRNLVYNFILSISQVLLPLLSIPYVSRVLDPEGIGRVGFIDSLTYYFVIIAEAGIMVYGIREVAKEKGNPEKLGKLVSELLVLHIIASLCTLVLYAAGVFFLWEKIGDLRLLLFSLSFFIINFFACDWYFMGREKFGFITWRTLIIRLAGLASIFLLIRQPADYYIYYAIIVASAVAATVWNMVVLFRDVPFSFRKSNWRRHLKHVWVTYLITLLYSVPLMLDNVLLRLVSTASAVGLYAFSIKIVRTGVNLLTDSFLVFLPRIVSLAGENDQGQLRQKLLLNIRFIILLSLPMGMGLYLLADELAHVFFGEKFLAVSDNLRLLAVFPFLKGVSLFLSNPVLIAHHKEKNFLRNLAGGTILFVAASIWLGLYYSDFGICMALIILEIFMLTANYISVKKTIPGLALFDFVTFGQSILASLFFIPVIYLIKSSVQQDSLRLIICIPACFILYGIFLLLVRNSFVVQVKEVVSRFLVKGVKGGESS